MKDETKETALKAGIIVFMSTLGIAMTATGYRPVTRYTNMETAIGYWLRDNTPNGSRVMTAETETAYYAKRLYMQYPNSAHVIEGTRTLQGSWAIKDIVSYAKRWGGDYIVMQGKSMLFITEFDEPPNSTIQIDGLEFAGTVRRGYDTATVWEVL